MEGMTSKQVGHLFENISSVFRQCIFSVLSVGPVPGHIAFIMDGNRRYSKKQNLVDGHGHRAGFSALIKMLKYCYELGVKYITVYAFSIDNFKRRPEEVESLMKLMQEKIDELIKEESIINRLGIRIYFQGNLKLLSEPVRSAAERAMVKTAAYSRAVLSVCVAYTSTDEIVHAVQESCEEKWDEIRKRDANGGNLIGLKENGKDKDEHLIGVTNVDRHMYMAVVPDPDIIIRTSGETRFSSSGIFCSGRMRPIFCGNFEFETRQSELERLFKRYGRVDRVDVKSGFAFVYMDNERDAEDAIQGLDRIEFGRKGRRLRVEWSKEERSRKPEGSRKSSSSSRVSKTLFVINFDPYNTRTRDLERHFDPHGKILNIRIRRNFAFIQFETQEDATRALDATNMSKLMDRVITVEYAIKDDDDRKNGYGPGKTYDRSPRRGYDRDRSRSPYGRGRSSPDYGRGRDRPSPDYGRGRDRPSPDYGRGRDRLSPDYGRGRDRLSPDYGRGRSPSPKRRERNSEYGRGRSPDVGKERMPDHENVHSPSPRQRAGSGNGRVSSPLERRSPGYGDRPSPSPQRERREKYSPDGYTRGSNPSSKPEPVESPVRDGRESSERYQSRSPPLRERSRS